MLFFACVGVGDAVALRKESVDRNMRREMSLIRPYVALRKESVDRNRQALVHCEEQTESLSARRAWIEIRTSRLPRSGTVVALRKESVDRNTDFQLWSPPSQCRSPQGERG